jgi:hypothetical protein
MAIELTINVVGWTQLESRIRRALKLPQEASGKALMAGGNVLLTESERICPKKTGRLASSGYVKTKFSGASDSKVEVGYDTGQAPYAVYVHENLDAHHESPTQAKYLEAPAGYMKKEMFDAIATQARREYNRWLRANGAKVK